MTDYQIKENEKFFKKIISSLNEGGVYLFPSAMEVYTKKADFLVGSKRGLEIIKEIVSKEFYIENFKLQKDGE